MLKKGATLLAFLLPVGVTGYYQTNPVGEIGAYPISFEGMIINTPASNGG